MIPRRRVERIASKFKEMTGSENSTVNVTTKIDSTPSRKRAPPSDDEKSSSVKQKVKKKRVDTGTPVRQKSKTDISKDVSKDIPKIKKTDRKKWDFSPLDPNEWEFENGEFICIFCGTGESKDDLNSDTTRPSFETAQEPTGPKLTPRT